MRRQNSVSATLYSHLYPRPTQVDPPNFSTHLARNLIPEIRVEVARFYGSLDSTEARYPGLNYTTPAHRLRLSSFPHHERLFAAIDELGLTNSEVLDLCRWEGTLWARERFERDEGIAVKDTTGDGIGQWVRPSASRRQQKRGIQVWTHVSMQVDVDVSRSLTNRAVVAGEEELGTLCEEDEMDDGEDVIDEDEDDGVDGEIRSIGNDLNSRLLAAVAARQRGEDVPMDPAFEQYLKEQIESGTLSGALIGRYGLNLHPSSVLLSSPSSSSSSRPDLNAIIGRLQQRSSRGTAQPAA